MRKNLLFALIAFVVSSIAHAQIEKGTVLLGGNIGLQSSKEDFSNSSNVTEGKSHYFGFFPAAGIAVKQNMIIGIELGYSHSKSDKMSYSSDDKGSNYFCGIFLRRYFPVLKNFNVFAQPGLAFSKEKREYQYENSITNQKSWNIGLGLYPGVSYAVSKRFHLETGLANIANISYRQSKQEELFQSTGQKSSRKRNEFSFSSNLSSNALINIGFRFFL